MPGAGAVHPIKAMQKHGMKVTVLESGSTPYMDFTAALAPLAKAQEAKFPSALVKTILDAQR